MSSKSSNRNQRLLHLTVSAVRSPAPVWWLVAALSAGLFYLAVAAWGYGVSGFPLDDAWIHQTYARNLGQTGQWAFVPGQPSAGSTAPLWSLLLSLGYWLGLPFLAWTYGLGVFFLSLTGWTMSRLAARLFPTWPRVGLWAGLFCIFEWHLIWAAVSGMETILFIWLSTVLVERYLAWQPDADVSPLKNSESGIRSRKLGIRDFLLGLLGSLLILTRPEGVGLVGLVGLDLAYREWRRTGAISQVFRRWVWLASGAGLLLIPYVIFHLWLTGLPLPNTFYAKQAEYQAVLTSFPLWWRLFGNFGPPVETVQGVFRVIFIGPPALLLPGLAVAGWLTLKERRAELVIIWGWWIGHLLLYGLRLPVTYQHGRYQLPVLPWVILLGIWGTARLLRFSDRQRLVLRAAGRALVLSLAILVLAFVVIGARAYGRDVHFIDSEMVTTARWLNEHIEPKALVAVHDIGAIGYFTQRPLIDLAGLITPEVIPIIRNEAALWEFITARQADYLVTFPTWYPTLVRNSALTGVFSAGAPGAGQADDPMTVYRLNSKP
jgi:hypothetical protein